MLPAASKSLLPFWRGPHELAALWNLVAQSGSLFEIHILRGVEHIRRLKPVEDALFIAIQKADQAIDILAISFLINLGRTRRSALLNRIKQTRAEKPAPVITFADLRKWQVQEFERLLQKTDRFLQCINTGERPIKLGRPCAAHV